MNLKFELTENLPQIPKGTQFVVCSLTNAIYINKTKLESTDYRFVILSAVYSGKDKHSFCRPVLDYFSSPRETVEALLSRSASFQGSIAAFFGSVTIEPVLLDAIDLIYGVLENEEKIIKSVSYLISFGIGVHHDRPNASKTYA